MFVRTSTYNRTVAELMEENTKQRMARLRAELMITKLHMEINFLQGQLAHHVNGGSNTFSDEDIKRLLMLCHPDKHGGKEMARQMTTKLLTLRKR